METKECKICNEEKSIEDFHKDKGMKDGRKNYCKACYKAKIYAYGDKEGDEKRKPYIKKGNEKRKPYIKKGWNPISGTKGFVKQPKPIIIKNGIKGKECNRCGDWKALTEYHKFRRLAYGLNIYCKECDLTAKRKYFKTVAGKNNSSKASHKRRTLLKNSKYTPFNRGEILKRDKYTCQFCGIKVHDRSAGNWNTPDKAHLDHIIPLNEGGETRAENLQVLCRTCNLEKGANKKGELQLTLF